MYVGELFVLLCLGLVAAWLMSPGFRQFVIRFIAGKPNLRFEELPGIFDGSRNFTIEQNPAKKMRGAQRSVQARSDDVSIIYHTTQNKDGIAETADIAYRGKFAMILTMVNRDLVTFQRIGGTTIENPQLSAAEENGLHRFMLEVRELFKEK